jgi:hypothetical protein
VTHSVEHSEPDPDTYEGQLYYEREPVTLNSPWIRGALYVIAVIAQIASFFVHAADKSGAYAEAMQSTANFVGALAGMTALGNLSLKK